MLRERGAVPIPCGTLTSAGAARILQLPGAEQGFYLGLQKANMQGEKRGKKNKIVHCI